MLLKKIVVAEDDDTIAHMVSMALGDAGFLCLRARDGEEALKLVKAHDPDLLVLDVMMPRVDGFEVARRLKADVVWSRTPILMLTALAAIDKQVEGLEAGADAYMNKPFDLREFSARVKALIRSARRERDRSPTTNLPGTRAIDEEVAKALKNGTDVALVHFDLLQFDSYADSVGYAAAENSVRAMAQLLIDVTRQVTGGGAFVGHVGGSDFIVVAAVAQAEAIAQATLTEFDARRAAIAPSSIGDGAAPVDIVIAISNTEGLGVNDSDEVARRLGRTMKLAKAQGKAGYVTYTPPPPKA